MCDITIPILTWKRIIQKDKNENNAPFQVAERMNDILRISAARRDAIAKTEEARSRNPPVQVLYMAAAI